ncbi:MAG: glycine cleavage system protein T [Actinobacteria bacterium RBG_16_64_13]|nr:MAG: glycine cleavage system protein T [Actinobacteria bacterium RBG_16_64_13]
MTADSGLRHTPLRAQHLALGAKIVTFAGWEMPLAYPTGMVAEHLATRRGAGLFDISHMGRFAIGGTGSLDFLQRVLSNNAAALDLNQAQYTFVPTPTGGAVDDAYLYRFERDEYLLVVNAANREKDWKHLEAQLEIAGDRKVGLTDRTEQLAMLSLQGPRSRQILGTALETGSLPEPRRNELSRATIAGAPVDISRSGYTGEPLCFELFMDPDHAGLIWDLLVEKGAIPCGLGARDTLRLEAALPLYGHELGIDKEGREIPLMSSLLATFAVSFSSLKGEFTGRDPLLRQLAAYRRILARDYSSIGDLPRLTRPVAVTGRGVARAGSPVLKEGRPVGWVTSGTMIPYWKTTGTGLQTRITDEYELRSICLCLVDSDVLEDEPLTIDIRGKAVDAVVVPYHLRGDAPPHARPIIRTFSVYETIEPDGDEPARAGKLLQRVLDNHLWRQERCVNLIPSEMTPSPLVRLVSVMDPAFRYAEHRKLEAFYDAEVFYYQGTGFIGEVERLLEGEICRFLGATEAETRLTSGQMANATVFSALVEYLNRGNPKAEPRRIEMVMNNHIGKGGHLSAQPMGALKDFVATDPRTDRPAVVNFPVLQSNPYRIDVAATLELIDRFRPRLIVFGKSMVLHKEPIAEVRRFVDEQGLDAVIMYDMAHVLGLAGPHFQEPFAEGADLVTGSTHKTFFGTQRGVIAGRWAEGEERYDLWEAVRRRTFPGSVSNHHLGTMLGLLLAAYEMNRFKDEYQTAVLANAKAFARALADAGLQVAGDPGIEFTETHQVLVEVGYGRGPEMARRLEANNIICNFQAGPDEEGFTASGSLRLGVAEMTRFGMGPDDFATLARLLAEVLLSDARVAEQVRDLRGGFLTTRYCFNEEDYPDVAQRLRETL